jgi:protein-tyrosine kinase
MQIENIAAHAASRQGPRKDQSIGRMLLDMGKLTQDDTAKVLAYQSEQGLRFGEAACRLGLVTESDIRTVLASQFGYQYAQPGQSRLDPALVAALEPFGEQAEMLRALRGQLMAAWFRDQSRTLAVVPVDAGAPAAALAGNLAIVFAQQGQRTVLVDANMRMPRQHELFHVGARTGLSDVLAGRSDDGHLLPVAPFDNLSLLCAGPQPPNPHELLGRPSFGALNHELSHRHDIVLYDAPPLSSGADAYAVANRARGVLLVVGRSTTRKAALREVRSQMLRSGVEIVGAILADA